MKLKNKYIIIAIDGAAGSGKSTTSRALCQKFNYLHADTGLHYRALTLFFLNLNIKPEGIDDFFQKQPLRLESRLEFFSSVLMINDQVYSLDELRNERMNNQVSFYARIPSLRNHLLEYQRSLPVFGQNNGFDGIVMDGRDIGSVVLKDAPFKFFLHADLSIRQSRRCNDGESDSIIGRDRLDSSRKIAPLTCPKDAVSIDTGLLSAQEVIDFISSRVIASS